MTNDGILKIKYLNNTIEVNIKKYTILVGEDHYILNFIIKLLKYLSKIINKDLTTNLKTYNNLLKFINQILYDNITFISFEDSYCSFIYDNGNFSFNNKNIIRKDKDIIFNYNEFNVHPNYLFDALSTHVFNTNYRQSKLIIYTNNDNIIKTLNLYIKVKEMALFINDDYKYKDVISWTYFIPIDDVSSYNITKNIVNDNLDYLNKNIKTECFNMLKLELKLKQLENI